ncbi:MAG: M48 family metalloprotease [Deltaproteobacteria bacterium]|nr:M48 family metalloprotease [Deltaproteobacteria bacterium]
MSYTNLIFFALTLLIYLTYLPQDKGNVATLVASLITLSGIYFLTTWIACHHLKRRIETKRPAIGLILPRVNSIERHFIILALFLYLYLVYQAGLKDVAWRMPFLRESLFFDLLAGIIPFVLFLLILWYNVSALLMASPAAAASARKTYLRSQIRMNAPLIFPVFLFALFQDILKLLPFHMFESADDMVLHDLLWFLPFLIFLIIFYPVIVKKLWGCYSMPAGPDRTKIEAHCRTAGLKISDILIWPALQGRALTAGIVGVVGKLRYFFISPELLSLLDDHEVESVVAHEAGHVKLKHLIYYLLFFLEFPLCMLLFSEITDLGLLGYADVTSSLHVFATYDRTFFSLGVLVPLAAFMIFYLRVVFGMLSRAFERQADLFAIAVAGHPLHLISALEKIAYYGGQAKDTPNWHHYSIAERIALLSDCMKNKAKIPAHHRRVRVIVRSFLSAVILTLLLIIGLNSPPLKRAIDLRLLEGQVQRLMAKDPENLDLQLVLAGILLEKNEYQQAEPLYRHILRIDPANVTALNNLAWLYAVGPVPGIGNSKKALLLAQQAAALKNEPYILDTLAEAYFRNGNRKDALKVIKEAIALQPDNLGYYLAQERRFSREGVQ